MSVDIRLNQMIDALDGRLKGVLLEDVELSVRTLKALKDCGASTLHDAQMALINRTLHKQKGIGPKAVKEVEEVIASVCLMMPAKSEHRRGTVYLSCGHEADTGCSGVDVTWADEECVAGEGFLPVTMFGVFCHECAQTFAYEEGKAAAVRTIEALTAENERLREALSEMFPLTDNRESYAEKYYRAIRIARAALGDTQ